MEFSFFTDTVFPVVILILTFANTLFLVSLSTVMVRVTNYLRDDIRLRTMRLRKMQESGLLDLPDSARPGDEWGRHLNYAQQDLYLGPNFDGITQPVRQQSPAPISDWIEGGEQ